MRRLEIHIDRLTLEGKSLAEGRQIVAAMERHLGGMVNQAPRAFRTSGAVIDRIDGGSIGNGAKPDAVGKHLAGTIFRNLRGSGHV